MEHKGMARFATVLVFALFLAGCEGAPSTLAPVSPSAIVMSDLMIQAFIIAAVVFVVVESLLIIAVLRHRHRDTAALTRDDLPVQTEGNNIFETAWTIAPAIVLAVVFYLSVIAYQAVENIPLVAQSNRPESQTINVRVVGYQFWWAFEYPDLNITTANEYHVPVNSTVILSIESGDVIHSYWVPRLGRKVDGIPGHVNHTWFTPLEVGTFVGECSELCGDQHAHMRFLVIVDSPEDFQAWVAQQQSPPPEMEGAAAEGEEIFIQGACKACHAIDGTEARGLAGPNLTHMGSRQTLAGGMLENNSENMAKWLANPQDVKPGNKMPDLGLTDEQVDKLVVFFQNLK